MNNGIDTKRILLIKGESQYDAMRIYIDELAIAFESFGYECTILDNQSLNAEQEFYDQLAKRDYSFIFTCNGMLLSSNLRKITDAYLCTWLFDHPVYHSERLMNADDKILVLTCDRNNCEYIQKHYPDIKNIGFIPLSGSYLTKVKPYKERTIDLLFTGSNLMPNVVYERIKNMPQIMFQVSQEMIDVLIQSPFLTIEQALSEVLMKRGLTMGVNEFHQILFDLRDVGLFIRGYFRDKVISSVVNAGIPIHVFGSGWENTSYFNQSNFVHHTGFGNESLKALADSKLSLNVMPWFKGGFQERIASAMLSKAVSITDTSSYLRENCTDMESIVYYNLMNISELPIKISHLLKECEEAEKIAQRGYELAISGHTWKNRAREILNYMDNLIN